MNFYFMQEQKKNKKFYAVGGRVLNFVSFQMILKIAKKNIIKI